jgi:hypothetical protein
MNYIKFDKPHRANLLFGSYYYRRWSRNSPHFVHCLVQNSWQHFPVLRLPKMGQYDWSLPFPNCFHFTFMWLGIVTNFFLIKPTDALISQIYFCQETLHVSGSSSAHHQDFPTVHSALVYVMLVWWQLSNMTRMVVLESCLQTSIT